MEYRKKMSPNDLGLTGSHQVGWHLAKVAFQQGVFPELSIDEFNPEYQVEIHVEGCGIWQFRLIWYNNHHHPERRTSARSRGRDEYRLTRGDSGQVPSQLASALALRPGDQLVFCREQGRLSLVVDRTIPDNLLAGLNAPDSRVREVQAEIDALLTTPEGAYPDWREMTPDESDLDDVSDCVEGSVYVLSNPSMPDMCKVGYTTRDPSLRARELFDRNTSVPTPFKVVGSVKVRYPYRLEKIIHLLWGKDRIHPGREFFAWDPEDAMSEIRKVAANWSAANGSM